MKLQHTLAAALLALGTALPALASNTAPYPCAVVKMISPYPPGGTTDILSRLLAPGMAKELGTNVIVENKAGASSNIGTEFVSSSAPDGCTLLLGNNTGVVINRNLYKLRIDPVQGLAPIGGVASVPLVLYVNHKLPITNLNELFSYATKHPAKLSYASGGSGSPQHLMGELLKLEKRLDIVHIPYKGQGPAMQDVIGGVVPMAFETTTVLVPQLANGRIVALATTGATRSKEIPNVPTMKELGLNDFVIENWYGLFTQAKTPEAHIQRLNAALNKVLKSPEVAASLNKMGSSDMAMSVQEMNAFITKELPFWEALTKRSGATVD